MSSVSTRADARVRVKRHHGATPNTVATSSFKSQQVRTIANAGPERLVRAIGFGLRPARKYSSLPLRNKSRTSEPLKFRMTPRGNREIWNRSGGPSRHWTAASYGI